MEPHISKVHRPHGGTLIDTDIEPQKGPWLTIFQATVYLREAQKRGKTQWEKQRENFILFFEKLGCWEFFWVSDYFFEYIQFPFLCPLSFYRKESYKNVPEILVRGFVLTKATRKC